MKYPKSEQYDKQFLLENMMGPNALKILEELTEGIKLTSDMKILDLGCGKGLTSIFLAKEFGVQVYATDLWITAAENFERFKKLGLKIASYQSMPMPLTFPMLKIILMR